MPPFCERHQQYYQRDETQLHTPMICRGCEHERYVQSLGGGQPPQQRLEAQDRLLLVALGFDATNRILSGYEAAVQFIQAQPEAARVAFKAAHPEGWTPREHIDRVTARG